MFELICGKPVDNLYTYMFTNWKALEDPIKKSKMLGLAIPEPGNAFEVWRFSLSGMLEATASMEAAFFATVGPSGVKGTVSERL